MSQESIFTHMASGRVLRRRKVVNAVVLTLTGGATLLALVPLVWITVYVLVKGAHHLNLDLLLHLPRPMGTQGGGVVHAVEGSALMVLLASLLAIPPALLAALYLAYRPHSALASALRFSSDLLAGIPSIVIGLFGYSLIVVPQRHYSALAGSITLSMIMLPVMIRSAEEMLKLVPRELREGALALGAPEWKTALTVVVPAAAEGITTGIMLAIARAAGETAPLLFTALGNDHYEIFTYVKRGIAYDQSWLEILGQILDQPTDALPLTLWKYAQQPYPERVQQAWAVAAVLMLFVLALNVAARLWLVRRQRQ